MHDISTLSNLRYLAVKYYVWEEKRRLNRQQSTSVSCMYCKVKAFLRLIHAAYCNFPACRNILDFAFSFSQELRA